MQRNGVLPALVIGTVTVLLAAVGYPSLPGAQDPRGDGPHMNPQPEALPAPAPGLTNLPTASSVSFVAAQDQSKPPAAKGAGSNDSTMAPAAQTTPTPSIAGVKSADGSTAVHQDGKTGVYTYNDTSVQIAITLSDKLPTGATVGYVLNNGNPKDVSDKFKTDPTKAAITVADLVVGNNNSVLFVVSLNADSKQSQSVIIQVRKTPPKATGIYPQNLVFSPGTKTVTVQFDSTILSKDEMDKKITIVNTAVAADKGTLLNVNSFNGTTVDLDLGDLTPGTYKLNVPAGIKDVFGNSTQAQTFELVKPVGSDLPLVAPGITDRSGPYVKYPEYTYPRTKPDGFNPGDHVETRVVRLYYFRDAHRVAQILNRDVKSYNRVTVDTRRRAAEMARDGAEKQSLARKVAERDAVQAAAETRAADKEYKDAQADYQQKKAAFDASQANPKPATTPSTPQVSQADVANAAARVQAAQTALQVAQSAEVQKRETWQSNLDLEDKMRGDQFRLEVAAMHEDPDTYAPGVPKSNDPVQQVSISVIGASEIHLRGPISGINIIREMINYIDAPTGQVRVSVHTVQVNGERQEKMENVVGEIQDYIDHSRFLTQQSALMLRKAILKVASHKAFLANQPHPFDTQTDRDNRYLYAFFGRDFTEELRVQKSEFLNTSNKLLSLNSMDTTSLASALFVLALAKNDTRREILNEFKQMLTVDLPVAEQTFYEAGGSRGKLSCWPGACCPRKHCMELMAQNAKFQSFFGFFDADVLGSDTLTPLQREFIKLAQILKSRLVTELEYKQRVMERALVEDRVGDYQKELKDAQDKQTKAKQLLEDAQTQMRKQQNSIVQSTAGVNALFDSIYKDLSKSAAFASKLRYDLTHVVFDEGTTRNQIDEINARVFPYLSGERPNIKGAVSHTVKIEVTSKGEQKWMEYTFTDQDGTATVKVNPAKNPESFILEKEILSNYYDKVANIEANLDKYNYNERFSQIHGNLQKRLAKLKAQKDAFDKQPEFDIGSLFFIVYEQGILLNHIADVATGMQVKFQTMTQNLGKINPDLQGAYSAWVEVKDAKKYFKEPQLTDINGMISTLENGFQALFQADLNRRVAVENLDRSRRPLDHKKMLDMLIDEIQDKYVELLEGTRSYTANIDDYIKRVATALDDDFNTQFYQPAFRQVRTIGTSWDVTLGQIETTSILTNNRTYAKVDPQATMEFDLPKRGILITEAFQSAKGLLDTYGALMQDPTFLNLARITGGMPTSTQALGTNAGVPAIRSVLPGLPGVSDESLMSQSGPGSKSFGTPLDALVPDPAIYKFETGTAFEIRPIIQPDGQSVSFRFTYMYSTNVREPVRADEKHLGRIKRHNIDTDVQLGNYELREISRYQVALRASRTAKGVPLLQDIPGLGVLFRPLPSAESSLQQNIILGQSTIFPTLFDLMGLRWAPAVADLDPLYLTNADFIVRQRKQFINNRVFDYSSSRVDEALQIPDGERRGDLYRTQQSIPTVHPNGYQGPGMGLRDSNLREGYNPKTYYPESTYVPSTSRDGHLDPEADRKYLKMMQQQKAPPSYPMGSYPPPGAITPGNPMAPYSPSMQHPPMPSMIPPGGGSFNPPMPQPIGPGPQSMNSPNPSSTVRLSSAELNSPANAPLNRSSAASGGNPSAVGPVSPAPAPRRTLWSMIFGN
jgi:hypothetical protein